MTVRSDPERNEVRALEAMVDFGGKRVLEVGCGDGRLTWLYAEHAAQVVAIEPYAPALDRAFRTLRPGLRDTIEFHNSALLDYASLQAADQFDVVLLSWSLC